MALLHYQNLTAHRPDVLMKKAFFGLKTFYDFLQKTKKYMESDAAVKRLAWKEGSSPIEENGDDNQTCDGVWIQLTEPADRPNEPDTTFRDFLDENNVQIYEVGNSDEQMDGPRRGNVQHFFIKDRSIKVLDRDPENNQLLLEHRPTAPELLLRPNTWPLCCQIKAIKALQNEPETSHLPLLRLFEANDHANWPTVLTEPLDDKDWMELTNEDRPGTDDQRKFVEVALATHDFAFLEGPPGSGKTTAICELVLQLVKQGKRVLLCASTHVAVDNVLERLMDEHNDHRDLVIPVRIGDRRNVSAKARPWQLERFIHTERERLLNELRRQTSPSPSQRSFLSVLSHGKSAIERLVLDASNLVCGTTIGILQHPDIKAGGQTTAAFDVLIVDEASKTTFQEFLVPALLAKRWIIVGDPKQLSPYVDDAAMAVNIEACLQNKDIRNACIDVFLGGHQGQRKRRVAAVATGPDGIRAYLAQGEARGVDVCRAGSDPKAMEISSVVVGLEEELERCIDILPLDTATVRAPDGSLPTLRRRAAAWLRMEGQTKDEQPDWASEIGWRLARLYEQRFAEGVDGGGRQTTAERLHEQVKNLLPVANTESVWREINRVRRVALPSVLESLRYGFERDDNQHQGTALSDGLPKHMLLQRHVLLNFQHRMHPDIAAFSHDHIYNGEALVTPDYIKDKRAWSYSRYGHRAIWLETRGHFNRRFNANKDEARTVLLELRKLDDWARNNPRNDGRPWEAAILTFYRGQEREIRKHLQSWTKSYRAMRHFFRGPRHQPHLIMELCTIDRFQGHEADLVLISIASPHPTSFLESPNRLNVALTRARYQRVVIGNRTGMFDARTKKKGEAQRSVLGGFASLEPWDQALKEVRR